MNAYTIFAPGGAFTGNMKGIAFTAGIAHASLDDTQAGWFEQRGYLVEPVAGPEASYPDLQAQAKELGIPATGKKDELAAAIAAELERQANTSAPGTASSIGQDQTS